MRIFLPILLLMATAFAGCAEDEPAPEELAPPPVVWQPHAYNFTNDASGCNLGIAVVLRDMAALAAFLPDGYTPADAQGLLGLPIPTGQGAALFSIYSCTDSAVTGGPLGGAEINILVEPPTGTNATDDLPAASTNFYLLEMVADANVTAALADAEFNVRLGAAAFRFNGIPPVIGSQGGAVVDDATYFLFNIPATTPSSLEGLSRFWQETPNGTAAYDYEMNAAVKVGHAACAFSADFAAAVAGDGQCTSGESFGITVADFAWTSTFRYLPHAAPAAAGNATA